MKTKQVLYETLVKAKEHLEYCGYGDSWERECADVTGLPEDIDNALKLYENETNKKKVIKLKKK